MNTVLLEVLERLKDAIKLANRISSFAEAAMLVLGVAFLATMPGCGTVYSTCHNCPPPTKQTQFVYTANGAGSPSTVSALTADPASGALTAIAGSPYPVGSGSIAVAADASGKFLFVANAGSSNISAVSINQTDGGLTQVAGSAFAAEAGMDSIAIDPTGLFLYAVTGNSDNLWAYSVNPSSGALTPLSGMPVAIAAGTSSSFVSIDNSGKFLYVAAHGSVSSGIYGFSRDTSTGAITALSGFPVAVNGLANRGTFDPAGMFLLVTGTNVFGTAGGVDVFSLDAASGALTLTGPATQVGDDPAGIVVAGGNVYVPNTAEVTISGFTLNFNTGALTAVSGSPFPSGGRGSINGPLGIATTRAGTFVFVCNASNDISVFSVGSGGALTPVGGSPFPDGGNAPSAITFVL
jgi:6-phosphogluconolactonase